MIEDKFNKLDLLLTELKPLWAVNGFEAVLPSMRNIISKDDVINSSLSSFEALKLWYTNSPKLFNFLEQISFEQLKVYQEDPKQWMQVLKEKDFLLYQKLQTLEGLTKLELIEPHPAQSHLHNKRAFSGIGGRKLSQILHLSEVTKQIDLKLPWLDWCSGKGYLGRVLFEQNQQAVTCFEWREDLCQKGQSYADLHQLDLNFVQGNAFHQSAQKVMNSNQHAVALHACGDLHVKLLSLCIQSKTQAITFSPCCYHLTCNENYQGLSSIAKQSQLALTRRELQIPVQETVTGGVRVLKHRQLEMTYRLAFDAMYTCLAHQETVQTKIAEKSIINPKRVFLPSIKKSLLAQGFKAFCLWGREQKQLTFALPSDLDIWLETGKKLFEQMEKINLLISIFRRPLEVWLAYDRALYLQEAGYQVELGLFCCKQQTPRNIYIQALKA